MKHKEILFLSRSTRNPLRELRVSRSSTCFLQKIWPQHAPVLVTCKERCCFIGKNIFYDKSSFHLEGRRFSRVSVTGFGKFRSVFGFLRADFFFRKIAMMPSPCIEHKIIKLKRLQMWAHEKYILKDEAFDAAFTDFFLGSLDVLISRCFVVATHTKKQRQRATFSVEK